MTQQELPLNDSKLQMAFEEWKSTPGGGHVMADLYRIASRYGTRWHNLRRRVSMRLLWELERDNIAEVRRRARRKGIELRKWKGYALNNDLAPYAAIHLETRRPDWKGMFEHRLDGNKKD